MQGGEAGVVLRPRGSAVWFRLGYRVDGAQLASGGRSESVEAVSFALGIGGRRTAGGDPRPRGGAPPAGPPRGPTRRETPPLGSFPTASLAPRPPRAGP